VKLLKQNNSLEENLMKRTLLLATALCSFALGAVAQEAEDPFADTVEMRHGLML
jgi:hypothetical protein